MIYEYTMTGRHSMPFIRDGISELILDKTLEDIVINGDKMLIEMDAELTTQEKKRLDRIFAKSKGMGGRQFKSFYEPIREETIETHDFANSSTWQNKPDSTWTLEPQAAESGFEGLRVKLTGIHVNFSEMLTMHAGGRLLVNFYMNGRTDPVFKYIYANMGDWITRSRRKTRIDYRGEGGPFMQYEIVFARPQELWSSSGIDEQGNPKFNKMTLHIEDHQPYKTAENQACYIGRGEYMAQIFEDFDA